MPSLSSTTPAVGQYPVHVGNDQLDRLRGECWRFMKLAVLQLAPGSSAGAKVDVQRPPRGEKASTRASAG